MADSTLGRFAEAMKRGMRLPKRQESEKAVQQGTDLGITIVGAKSTDEEIAQWEARLWADQDDAVDELAREWRLHLYYTAGIQHLAYHRERGWFVRRAIPGRIRSTYNVCAKAVGIRVSRLTENKPTVTVQARTSEQSDLDRAEMKETLFWGLWDELRLHAKLVQARRWASKCGSGILKCGWDPDAGPPIPATRKTPVFEDRPIADPTTGQPAIDPATGQPMTEKVLVGIKEEYLDEKGEAIGLVTETTVLEDGSTTVTRNEPPEGTRFYHDGQAYVDVRTSFNVRWDPFEDDIGDSWYVQDAEILPTTAILAMFPDALKEIQDATPATEAEKLVQWRGLVRRVAHGDYSDGPTFRRRQAGDGGTSLKEVLEQEYLVRETFIFPKTIYLRKLWGPKGAHLITVGGKLVHKKALPAWALRACPFVQLVDIPEEGNHYGRPFLRDLIPVQDDINRTRSHSAEGIALRDRLILTAPHNHQMRVRALGELPGVLVTSREGTTVQTLDLGQPSSAVNEFYNASLSAAQDVGYMNDASTGKLPSAGLAAKAVYALQYADERSIAEVSTMQDDALRRLAEALDAITSVEYREDRKVRIVGHDRLYQVEADVTADALNVEVDYAFVPGSMLARQKEAIKNELLALMQAGLIDQVTVKKLLPTAVPDAFRNSYSLQYARARRQLMVLERGEAVDPPQPWEDPAVHLGVLEEVLLSQRFERFPDPVKQAITERWQAFRMVLMQQQAPQPAPGQPGVPEAPPIGANGQAMVPAQGAEALAQAAEMAMAPGGEPPMPEVPAPV
ncbi:MAG: hypothetical protein AB7N73_14470 [Gemmatimonadales bacterium]